MRLRDTTAAIAGVAALATAVLAVGGALRWTEGVVAILVALAAIPLVTSRRGLDGRSPLVVVFAVALGLTAIQLIPLPGDVLDRFTPVGQALRSEGAEIAGVHPWQSISLDVPGTLHAIAYFTILIGVALVALRLVGSERGRLAGL